MRARTMILLAILTLSGCEARESESNLDPDSNRTSSSKGWALYSWEVGGDWSFSLVPDTNGVRWFYEEQNAQGTIWDDCDHLVGAPTTTWESLTDLKARIGMLQTGESIFWYEAGEEEAPRTYGFPPDPMLKEVTSFCAERGYAISILDY